MQTALAVARQSAALETDARFRAVLEALQAAPATPPPRRTRASRTGFPGRIEVRDGTTRITVDDAGKNSFGALLTGEMDRLYAAYLKQRAADCPYAAFAAASTLSSAHERGRK